MILFFLGFLSGLVFCVTTLLFEEHYRFKPWEELRTVARHFPHNQPQFFTEEEVRKANEFGELFLPENAAEVLLDQITYKEEE